MIVVFFGECVELPLIGLACGSFRMVASRCAHAGIRI